MDFVDIVMEARKKKSKKKEEEETTEDVEEDDLPEDDGEPEDLTIDDEETPEDTPDDDLPEDDGDPEDLTAEDDTVESETEEEITDGGEGDLPAEDGDPEDLTTDDEGTDPEAGGEGGDLPPEDGDPEDLTGDGEGDLEGGDVGGDGTPEEGEGDVTDDMEVEPEEDPIDQKNDARDRRLLQEDFTNLYFRSKDFLLKLTSLDKSDVILNQVVVQIDRNLNRLKTALWDYTVYEYDKNEYVTNLFRYNEFIEVFKVNLDMLTKAKEFILSQREENEKQVKKTKKS